MTRHWKFSLCLIFCITVTTAIFYQLKNRPDLFAGKKTITFSKDSGGSLEDYYKKAQSLMTEKKYDEPTATFLAVGDIMLSRNVALKIQQEKNAAYPFLLLKEILKSSDFNFGNLETPVAEDKAIIGGHSLVFNSPKEAAAELKNYNFQILNLANNHAFDQGLKGLNFTRYFLDSHKIQHIGTGADLSQAWQPAIVTANGINIGFVGASYASVNDGGKTQTDYVARTENLENLKSTITELKAKTDFIIITMHAGTEYTRSPNKQQEKFAHAAIDLGADMVIGAHPHWVQTIEQYCPNTSNESASPLKCANPKFIFYSLGNFIFDQDFSQDVKEGLVLKIQLSKSGCDTKKIPTPINNLDDGRILLTATSTGEDFCGSSLQGSKTKTTLKSIEPLPIIIEDSQPRLANEIESKNILKKINIKN